METTSQRLLLIDTCGETAGVAVCEGTDVVASENLLARETSANILPAIRRVLTLAGFNLANLSAVGVVGGPGSFTGVRTGLAVAKGLCEATGLRAAVVSRLGVLADVSAIAVGISVLDAGRGELYVHDAATGNEWLSTDAELIQQCDGHRVVVAEAGVALRLAPLQPLLRSLHVTDALPCILRCVAGGGSDIASADSNYLRNEQMIYKSSQRSGQEPVQKSSQPTVPKASA